MLHVSDRRTNLSVITDLDFLDGSLLKFFLMLVLFLGHCNLGIAADVLKACTSSMFMAEMSGLSKCSDYVYSWVFVLHTHGGKVKGWFSVLQPVPTG
jgi:hypothetical protein